MAFSDDYAAAQNPIVQNQVQMAFLAEAQNVYTESTSTPGHTTRAAFATEIVNGKVNWLALVLTCCAFAALTPTSTDTTVSNAVTTLWSMFAGA